MLVSLPTLVIKYRSLLLKLLEASLVVSTGAIIRREGCPRATLPKLSTVEQQMEKGRERSTKWCHNMVDEQKAERNDKRRASRECGCSHGTTIVAGNEDQIDVICATSFGSGALEVDD
ncbi:hypothetical protein PVAP13_9KG570000 [Panicum virgatum]|uniref:Uncharacterized protein n=1 Tax=Panicum virgatum TaxID=38727 RepID=A0A8T0NZU3_PANVG|nr:hypothetical protein PVAP13_9KG570000 [Panicum virgatum]